MKAEAELLRQLASPAQAPGLLAMLREDVACVFQRDPAARSTLELLTIYPGIQALVLHRFAHVLWRRGWRYLPRLLSFLSRLLTNIDIHPGATLGRRFFIDHGAGVVIGETAEVGEDVTLYHGVTLGGTTWRAGKRHPTLGNGVVVGAGAKILGAISVGDRVRVAANSVVIDDVKPGVTVVGIPGRAVLPKEQRRVMPGGIGIDLDHHQIPDPVGKAISCLLERIADLEREVQRLKGDPLPEQAACRACDDSCSQPEFDSGPKEPKQGAKNG
ncbi:serine O-acetyltransferase [Uliginosibacterium sp. 31-12]|uniref:serine O-acetyltransferase n=1 Tax=Uliginosibacterium sp. 31-12 TaxID=3062781 RepID=UPI0026E31AFB|nr:serine O-acetyltransferase [Uliginosibacterium sp. 31-12]MDO6385371.1 serine O-acetyltransferase [Uliginosibacterium sp. 31-12]